MSNVTEEVVYILEDHYPDKVYSVEDGHIWVSGMNANCKSVAKSMAQSLVHKDIPCGLVYDDDAVYCGGVQFRYEDPDKLDL